mmetsp:Transcript_8926/g.32943  ORF Transcript_8926/g.32943 Transcript_8926/m.32943 type:complete len:174 (-) Transcript_8926:2134-2655(-)
MSSKLKSYRFRRNPSSSKKSSQFTLSDEQKQEIREAFDLFDTDKDAAIDSHELKVALRALGFHVKKDEIHSLMALYDEDETGHVTFQQFLTICTEKMADRDPLDEIRKAFMLFDDDKSGTITVKNLRKVAREIGENMSDEELHAMIDEFAKDREGEISEDEFLAIMRNNGDDF